MSNSSVSSSDSSSSQHQQLIQADLTGGGGAQNFTKSTPPATTLSSLSSTRSTSAKTTRSLVQQAKILSRYDIDSIFMTIRIFRSFRLPSGPIQFVKCFFLHVNCCPLDPGQIFSFAGFKATSYSHT